MDLFLYLLLSLILNGGMFLFAYRLQSDKLTDISYAVTFVVLTAISFLGSNRNAIQAMIFGFVVVWAIRIGSFLLKRVIHMKKDARFDKVRHKPLSFLSFWIYQAITAWVILIPVFYMMNSSSSTFNIITYIGIIIWALGYCIESFADKQKFLFKINPKNTGKWIESGLWKYSRHPNYFGEISCWLGIYLIVFSSLSPMQQLIGFIGPLWIYVALRYVSGVPILEKKYDKRYKKNKAYQQYKQNTNLLIPWCKQ